MNKQTNFSARRLEIENIGHAHLQGRKSHRSFGVAISKRDFLRILSQNQTMLKKVVQ